MKVNTANYSIDIKSPHLEEFHVVFCSYCGKELTIRNIDGGYFWRCDCPSASKELKLKEHVLASERALQEFYETTNTQDTTAQELSTLHKAITIIKGEN